MDIPGLLLTLKGKTVRTPVNIIITEKELPQMKIKLRSNNIEYKVEEIFDFKDTPKENPINVEKIIQEESVEHFDENFSKEISIEELSIKYETLLDKMMKSTK